jgi:hypothetical protein
MREGENKYTEKSMTGFQDQEKNNLHKDHVRIPLLDLRNEREKSYTAAVLLVQPARARRLPLLQQRGLGVQVKGTDEKATPQLETKGSFRQWTGSIYVVRVRAFARTVDPVARPRVLQDR